MITYIDKYKFKGGIGEFLCTHSELQEMLGLKQDEVSILLEGAHWLHHTFDFNTNEYLIYLTKEEFITLKRICKELF